MSDVAAARDRPDVPILDIDPFSDHYLRAPFSFQAELRAVAPVVFIPKYDCYAVGRYEPVRVAFSDWKRFSSSSGTGLGHIGKGQTWRTPGPIVESDPPDHTALRTSLNRILSPVVVRNWRLQFDAEADRFVEDLLARGGEFDGLTDLVEPFVLKVFPDALGIESAGRENLLAIGEMTGNALGPPNELLKHSVAVVEPTLPWFNSKFERAAMLPGGFGEKIWQLADSGEISTDKVVPLLRTFLRGGMDTVMSAISSALWLLAQNPQAWQQLQANPVLSRAAFDETIRLETPAQCLFRTTKGLVDFFGFELKDDMKVLCSLAAANRDPDKWPDADRFDLMRNTSSQLALGTGVHTCLGQMIARFETDAILNSLLKRAATLELVGKATHRLNNTARRLDQLPLKVTAK